MLEQMKGLVLQIKDLASPHTGQQQYIQEVSQCGSIVYSIIETRGLNQAIESWLNTIASKDILIKGFTASLPVSQLQAKIDFFSVSSFFLLNFILFYLEGGISRTEGR